MPPAGHIAPPHVSKPSSPSPSAAESVPAGGVAPSPALVRALRRVMRPLVNLMLARGITYPYLADLLKRLFVEVAEQEFRIDGKPCTDSRVSLISGVHRKDVSRLRGLMQTTEPAEPSVVPRGAQLAALWMADPRYLQPDGQPLPLPRLASEGGERSFEALVASVNTDIRSRVVLDEWLRLGVVHLDESDRVCLHHQAFVPSHGADEKAFYLGHNLHDHAAAAVHNLLDRPGPFMERSVHYNALSHTSVMALRQQAEQQGMKALLAINQAALAREGRDALGGVEGPPQRITFGIYFYSEPAPADDAQAADKPVDVPPRATS